MSPRVMGKNKDEVGSIGSSTDSLDQYNSGSPSDHQHQYVGNSKFLTLLGTFSQFGSYPPCRIYSVGDSIFLHGVIESSGAESDICEIPPEFLPGEEFLPLSLITPGVSSGGVRYPLILDTDNILKFTSSETWSFVDLSLIRYMKR